LQFYAGDNLEFAPASAAYREYTRYVGSSSWYDVSAVASILPAGVVYLIDVRCDRITCLVTSSIAIWIPTTTTRRPDWVHPFIHISDVDVVRC